MRPCLPSPQSLPAPPESVRQSPTYIAPSGPVTIWQGRNSGSFDLQELEFLGDLEGRAILGSTL